MNSAFSDLSGGWQSRCRLATALLVQTDVLLLDEPSNFMVSSCSFSSLLSLDDLLKREGPKINIVARTLPSRIDQLLDSSPHFTRSGLLGPTGRADDRHQEPEIRLL